MTSFIASTISAKAATTAAIQFLEKLTPSTIETINATKKRFNETPIPVDFIGCARMTILTRQRHGGFIVTVNGCSHYTDLHVDAGVYGRYHFFQGTSVEYTPVLKLTLSCSSAQEDTESKQKFYIPHYYDLSSLAVVFEQYMEDHKDPSTESEWMSETITFDTFDKGQKTHVIRYRISKLLHHGSNDHVVWYMNVQFPPEMCMHTSDMELSSELLHVPLDSPPKNKKQKTKEEA